jgi:hypothetical protein
VSLTGLSCYRVWVEGTGAGLRRIGRSLELERGPAESRQQWAPIIAARNPAGARARALVVLTDRAESLSAGKVRRLHPCAVHFGRL